MPDIGLNPFLANNAFGVASLTEAINILPQPNYGKITQMGLFNGKGVTTSVVFIEVRNGSLHLLPTSPRGAPATLNTIGKRNMRPFVIPHIALDDVILPEEVQSVRAFGSMSAVETLGSLMNDKMEVMKAKYAITAEWQRFNSLKGILLDADGITPIYNYFTEFGVTPSVITFNFSSATLDVRQAILNTVRYMEDNLLGETMTKIKCIVSPEFFDALTNHPNVKAAFQYFTTTQQLSGDYRTGFQFAGVEFEEYRGYAVDPSGTSHRFLPAGTAQFFPMGTTSTFREYWAPADFNETVNTIGQEYYAKQKPRDFDRGTDLHTQSNRLPLVMRPALLVQANIS